MPIRDAHPTWDFSQKGSTPVIIALFLEEPHSPCRIGDGRKALAADQTPTSLQAIHCRQRELDQSCAVIA
jgi:hypothetical protein